MDTTGVIRYPVGQQDFSDLRLNGYVYVDKTMYIRRLVQGPKYCFLGRPRRFGKSLFLSTVRYFWEGRRELFTDLDIESMPWSWDEYPVLVLDLNTRQFRETCDLEDILGEFLQHYESKYRVERVHDNLSSRFGHLIRSVAAATGRNVVILVDEYDKPLVNNIHNPEMFGHNRDVMAAFYSHFKSQDACIRSVFLTGVSRFGGLSVFSALNNISDLSFLPDYAAVCGITADELHNNFKEGIARLAMANGRTCDEELQELKRWYDGYHFSEDLTDIYNPYCIMNVLAHRKYSSYWVRSGAPTLLAEALCNTHADLSRLFDTRCSEETLAALDIDTLNVDALLYQTGYLTIKDYNPQRRIYRLGLPNEEIKQGFFEFLLPWYAHLRHQDSKVFVFEMIDELESGHIDGFMKRLQSMFAGFGYEMKFEQEVHVQNVMVALFTLIGMSVDAEWHTSDGRIDILLRTGSYIYIIELKFDTSAREALDQIERKRYDLPWSADGRTVIALGINYSTSHRRPLAWLSKTL